jgi:hypothetical protein
MTVRGMRAACARHACGARLSLSSCSHERQAGEDPYIRQAMARMEEGGTSSDFVSILEGLPQLKAARCNAAVIEAVLEFVDSKNKHIRRAAETCVMGLMKKNNEELAKAMVEMCSDPGARSSMPVLSLAYTFL